MVDEVLEEIILKGGAISDGVAIGCLYYMEGLQEEIVPEFSIPTTDIEKEIDRYRRAILSSRKDLRDLKKFLAKEGSKEAASIIDTHMQMLDDPFMTTLMEKKIRQRMKNTETVFRCVMADYEKEFSKIKDQFFKQRLLDVKDLSQRILRNLHPRKELNLQNIPDHSIIFTKEPIPSNTAQASKWHVIGLITEIGGATSHAALIARSKGIPYVANISIETLSPLNGSLAILDGKTGLVIINPTESTLKKYQKRQKLDSLIKTRTAELGFDVTQTLDGVKIEILANMDHLSDLDLLTSYRVEGIGLFRSEFLFFEGKLLSFSEDKQLAIYKKVMEKVRGIPVVFRVFDMGGDKGRVGRTRDVEPNPALGCRGIRFLLRSKKIFINQIRALLKASVLGDLKILLPMISDLEELHLSKEIIQKVAFELRSEGYEIPKSISLGCMIEVPSAVYMVHAIARECDFISIGTNDLVQYTLAADRAAEEMHAYYRPTHPSIFRMILHIIQEAKVHNTPVSICGEMASNLRLIPLLLGLGIRKLSCSCRSIPKIKKVISQLSIAALKGFTEEALSFETAREVEAFLEQSTLTF